MMEILFYAQEVINTLCNDTINQINVFVHSEIDNETHHFKEMLKQPDSSDFIKAMEKEINYHETRNHQELCKRFDIPKGMKTIISTQAFKRKWLPTGELIKYKAGVCAHSGQQKWDINYWETYSPVANWESV